MHLAQALLAVLYMRLTRLNGERFISLASTARRRRIHSAAVPELRRGRRRDGLRPGSPAVLEVQGEDDLHPVDERQDPETRDLSRGLAGAGRRRGALRARPRAGQAPRRPERKVVYFLEKFTRTFSPYHQESLSPGAVARLKPTSLPN